MKKDGCKPGEFRMGRYCIPEFCKKVIDHYGHTHELLDTGWMLPDGSVIDMSKLYHTDIEFAGTHITRDSDVDMTWRQPFDSMHKFMVGCRAIRYRMSDRVEAWGRNKLLYAQMVHKPTSEQSEKLIKLIQQSDIEHAILEKTNEKTAVTECFIDLHKPLPFDYWKFIERCFK